MDSLKIFCQFVSHINDRDVDALCDLMSENHKFIDSLGNVFSGRETMRKGWISYFNLFPDYRISCELFFQQDNIIAATGTVSATYSPDGQLLEQNRWAIPAALKAVIENGQVSEWQVFADNEPVRQILSGS